MQITLGFRVRLVSLCLLVLALVLQPAVSQAAAQSSATTVTLSGSVLDPNGALPVSGATVQLQQGIRIVASTKTDKYGSFTFAPVPQGVYTIAVHAEGYQPVTYDEVALTTSSQSLTLTMQRAASSTQPKSIGRVVVTGSRAGGLQTTTTIQRNVDTQVLATTNQIRVSDALGKLPGVNYISQSSAIGDDIGIDIRGLKPSETQVMLDGHPIGPLGVYPASLGGGNGGFDFQDSPFYAVENTLVTYGSGAVGLYGVDAVGGSIDLQTINPTTTPQGILRYGFGEYGKQLFSAQTTGTIDKVGFVLLHGVTGTYGDFAPQIIAQTGARGNDFTSATLAKDTYLVTGDYTLRNDLAKLRYAFSPATSLTLTAYSATSWDDKTGNGDNDFVTYDKALFDAQTNTSCTTPSGAPGVPVTTDAGSACFTPQQFAKSASGPAGGGQGAHQTIGNQDYHARFLTALGHNQIALDFFVDNYNLIKTRPDSNINGPMSSNNNVYRSVGQLVSDDIATDTNDLGFGFYTQRQYTTGTQGTGASPGVPGGFTPYSALFAKIDNFFLRDAWTPSIKTQYFLNAWFKHSLVGGNSFDPRLSVVYRPDAADVVRVTGGGSSADPAPLALNLGAPGGINPGNCQQFGIATVPTSKTLPEKASDLEASLAHRFFADTTLQFTAYDTNEVNTIFEGNTAAALYAGIFPPGYLNAVFSRIESICPNFFPPNPPPTINNLQVTTNLNLAKSRARGFEISGRLRASDHFYVDGYYNVQSTTIFDPTLLLLQQNPILIPGSQLPRIPLHKWGISYDASNDHGGELYMTYTQYDSNNAINRTAYGVCDASLSQRVTQSTTVTLGVSNLFNQAVDNYGRIGFGVFIPENQFGTDTSGLQQGTERFGLAPAQLSFTVTQRI